MDDAFEAARRANARGAVRHSLEQLQRDRESRRDMQPLPEGSLFDLVTRAQRSLFDEGR
jgi:hypothetical protein